MNFSNMRNVDQYVIGKGTVRQLEDVLRWHFYDFKPICVYFVDRFFEGNDLIDCFPISSRDQLHFVDIKHEPKTTDIDELVARIQSRSEETIDCVIGVGGGSVLDITKAVSIMLSNDGNVEDYLGWDLVPHPSIYNIGIPTLSGSGTESSTRCVLKSSEKGGNFDLISPHNVFSQLILDPDLSATAKREQYFYSAMETYLRSIEFLHCGADNVLHKAIMQQVNSMCQEVFLSDEIMSDVNRELIMSASYLGGAISRRRGMVHYLSNALSVVLEMQQGLANCLVMNALDGIYKKESKIFQEILDKQQISLPTNVCSQLRDEQFNLLYEAATTYENLIMSSDGQDYKSILNKEEVLIIFKKI